MTTTRIAKSMRIERIDDHETGLPDIKPKTQISSFSRDDYLELPQKFPIESVSIAVGMSKSFIRKVVGIKDHLTVRDVLRLLDQDSFKETIVPRSKVIDHLLRLSRRAEPEVNCIEPVRDYMFLKGHTLDLLRTVPRGAVQCVVTSTPYWGMRIYNESYVAEWSDWERAAYGHEQTPEGFIRHTVEVLASLYDVLSKEGSIWWNIMDSFNTRTQIRGSALEALYAMQGKDGRSWAEHDCRRYSSGHSYLKDGEQCVIPGQIAERASRIGFYVKSIITWAKTSSLPEPQESRVSRNLEYVLHFSKVRKPLFQKQIYRELPARIGGRNKELEPDKLSDIWTMPTSAGGNGHGAQFPISLPARCIALSSREGDLVLDPFVGAGNSALASHHLRRRFLGFDVCEEYLGIARRKMGELQAVDATSVSDQNAEPILPSRLL